MLEALFRAIDKKAQLEIDKIQEEQEEAILALSKNYNKECEQKYYKAKDVLFQRIERETTEAQKKLELQNKFVIEQAKRQILEETYRTALLKIDKLNDDGFRKVVERMVKILPAELIGQVKSGKRTAPILRSLLSGHRLAVKDDLSEEGFVVITPNLEIDLRFSQALNQNREKTDPEVFRILFAPASNGDNGTAFVAPKSV